MAEVVTYPMVHCVRCWADEPTFGVLDGSSVIGPFCHACAERAAAEINGVERIYGDGALGYLDYADMQPPGK